MITNIFSLCRTLQYSRWETEYNYKRIFLASNNRFNLDNISEEDAKTLFRFKKEDIDRVRWALEIPDTISIENSQYEVTGKGMSPSVILFIISFIWIFRSWGFMYIVEKIGLSK